VTRKALESSVRDSYFRLIVPVTLLPRVFDVLVDAPWKAEARILDNLTASLSIASGSRKICSLKPGDLGPIIELVMWLEVMLLMRLYRGSVDILKGFDPLMFGLIGPIEPSVPITDLVSFSIQYVTWESCEC